MQPCWHVHLGLPASWSMRNKLTGYKSPSPWYFVISRGKTQLTGGRHKTGTKLTCGRHTTPIEEIELVQAGPRETFPLPCAVTWALMSTSRNTGKLLYVQLITLVELDQETCYRTWFISWPHPILGESCSWVFGHSTEGCFESRSYQPSSSISGVICCL